MSFSLSSMPSALRMMDALSLSDDCMNLGRSRASFSTKLSSSLWPDLVPVGSVTFREQFLPVLVTTRPLSSSTRMLPG